MKTKVTYPLGAIFLRLTLSIFLLTTFTPFSFGQGAAICMPETTGTSIVLDGVVDAGYYLVVENGFSAPETGGSTTSSDFKGETSARNVYYDVYSSSNSFDWSNCDDILTRGWGSADIENFYLAWDQDYLYLAVKGPNAYHAYDGRIDRMDLFIAIDVDDVTDAATPSNVTLAHTAAPFSKHVDFAGWAPEYFVAVERIGSGDYAEFAAAGPTTLASDLNAGAEAAGVTFEYRASFGGDKLTEVRIPWSLLGGQPNGFSGDTWNFAVYTTYDDDNYDAYDSGPGVGQGTVFEQIGDMPYDADYCSPAVDPVTGVSDDGCGFGESDDNNGPGASGDFFDCRDIGPGSDNSAENPALSNNYDTQHGYYRVLNVGELDAPAIDPISSGPVCDTLLPFSLAALNPPVSTGDGTGTFTWYDGDPAATGVVVTDASAAGDYWVVYEESCFSDEDSFNLVVETCMVLCDTPSLTLPADLSLSCSDDTSVASTGMATTDMATTAVWINEIHYDNASGDVNEGVEIAGTAGLDLAGYQIVAYNGSGGVVYDTENLVGTIDDEGCGAGALWFPISGLQNGGPDGIALIDPMGGVVEFLSYEGSFTATDGPANGSASTDIGVAETSSTPIGESLQLTGTGGVAADFSWVGPSASSPGTLNAGQTACSSGGGATISQATTVTAGSCPQEFTITRTWTATADCGTSISGVQTITVADTTAPTISCPADILQPTDAGMSIATITVPTPSFSDDCGVVTITNDFNGTADASGAYPIGMTTVIFTATDECGNSDTCSMLITVENSIAVELTCPADISVDNDPGLCGAAITYADPTTNILATVTQIAGLASGSNFPVGTTTNTFVATDGSSSDTCSFTITVTDNEPPALSCPPDTAVACAADVPAPAASLAELLGSLDPLCLFSENLDFGTSAAQFDFGTGDITNAEVGGANLTNSFSFDIWDEATGTVGPGGADDIFFEFSMVTGFDPYGGVVLDAEKGTTHNSEQSGSGLRGTTPINQTAANNSSTGDVHGWSVRVYFAPHVSITAEDFDVLMNSVNTTGEAFESMAIEFLAPGLTPYGTATYAGYYSTPPLGVPGGIIPPVVNTNPWTVTGSGVYIAGTDSIDLTDVFNPAAAAASPASDGFDPNAAVDGVLNVDDIVQGFDFTVLLEDVAATLTDGDVTSSFTTFTSTLNGINIGKVSFAGSGISDNCCLDSASFAHVGDVSDMGTCPETITRTYQIADCDSNVATCTQVITITADNAAPVLTLPADTVVSCLDDTSAATLGTATAVSNCGGTSTPEVWINELHYDNASGDVNEGVEIAGTAGVDLSAYEVVFYNGSGGTSYSPTTLSGILPDEGAGYGAIFFPVSGIQNGAPDGLALVETGTGTVIAFLSYEGSFTATDGPANGETSVDLGVSETSSTPIGESLQLTGSGSTYTDFAWSGPAAESPGALNSGQTLLPGGGGLPVAVTSMDSVVAGLCPGETTIYRKWEAIGDCGDVATGTQVITVENNLSPAPICSADTVFASTAECDLTTAPATIDVDVTTFCAGLASIANDYNSDTGLSTTDNFPVGETTVTFTFTDSCGNVAMCSRVVVVSPGADLTAPMINCPADTTVQCSADLSTAALGMATATDNCDTVPVITSSDQSVAGTCMGEETILRTWYATDAAGNVDSCVQTISTIDTVAPTITCFSDTIFATTSDCSDTSAFILVLSPPTSDNCGAPVTVVNDYNGTSGASGDYPLGYTTVTWTGTDDCGNSSSCSFVVCVTAADDVTPPSISCPADTTVACNADMSIASLGMASATDDCSTPAVASSDTTIAGGCGGDYTLIRTWTATDAAGNSTSCQQTITVIDTVAPIPSCEADTVFATTAGCAISTASVGIVTPAFSENCSAVTIVNDYNGTSDASDTYPLGNTTVNWTFMDGCGNTSNCTVVVVVAAGADVDPPSISCPADTTVVCNGDMSIAALGMATATDDCGTASISSSDSIVAGSCASNYTLIRTWTAVDPSGNMAACNQTIAVVDTIAPVISLATDTFHVDLGLVCPGGTMDTVVTPPAPTAIDECGTVSIINSLTGTSDATAAYSIGFTTLTWTAADDCGNQSIVMQVVEVTAAMDTIAPTISCPTNIFADSDPGICGAAVNYLAPTATDDCGVTVSLTSGLLPGSVFPVGTTINTFIATDAAGNQSTCAFSVIVTDVEAPTIVCANDTVISNGAGICDSAVYSGSQLLPLAMDNCPGVSVSQTSGIPNGGNYPLGTTTNTWTATDASGLTAMCMNTITVIKDSIICSAVVTDADASGLNGAIDLMILGGAGPFTYAWSTGDTTQDLSGLLVGTYVVTITDANGCTETKSFDVDAPVGGPCRAPDSFQSLQVKSHGGRATYRLCWNPVPGAVNYTLCGRQVGGGPTQCITVSGNCRRIKKLEIGETYEWFVITNCADGSSSDTSDLQTFTIPIPRAGELDFAGELEMYPVPASSFVNLTYRYPATDRISIQLVDLTGREMDSRSLSTTGADEITLDFDVTSLPAGVYMIRVIDGTHQLSRKFTVVH